MKKADIIKTAFRVWGRTLYQSTSLSEIAQELGVSKSALYRHFENKQALLEAMYEQFFTEYVAFIKPQYDKARLSQDRLDQLFSIMRIAVEYYVRNRDTFIFCLVQVYGNQRLDQMVRFMIAQGLDMQEFQCLEEGDTSYPSAMQLVTATLTFLVAYFHKHGYTDKEGPADEQVGQFIAWVETRIAHGLGLYEEAIDALDFEELESRFGAWALGFTTDRCHKDMQELEKRKKYPKAEDGSLLNAVASVVAEAGPWNVSMDMVARRSGLSKSGLYSHFKNKQDMLRHLFMREFQRILGYAEGGLTLSAIPEEQLYLVILSIVDCLRSHPKILQIVDWLRTRPLNLSSKSPEVLEIFSAIKFKPEVPISEQTRHLIFFLIINTLMLRPQGMAFSELPNKSVRILFRFIALGVSSAPRPPRRGGGGGGGGGWGGCWWCVGVVG
ncbi:MAG: TetR/AcrR family transcriptional regulator, partial [Treponema sp.]|nr:TetR/AcrR family transcriptional regulator [Treponema sp.]